ncbi:MAG: phage tail tip lysozyme [Veillonella caviae]|nr:phage tail tip lysozyme [Veillonella caviae]
MNSFGDIKKKYDSGNNYNSFEDINTAYNGEPETNVLDNIANAAKSAYDWIDNETRYVDNQLTKAKDAVVSGVSNAADYASVFVSNTAQSVGNWAQDTFKANMDYRDAIERAETAGTIFSNGPEPTQEEVIEKGAKAYDVGIGKPAMYVAMTPYAPKNVKAQAGVLALPTIVRDTMHSFDQNSQVAESEGGGFGDAVLNTAKGLVVDPIVEPMKAWYDNPSAQADVIRQGGLGALYDNVLMPFEGIRGAYHAGKAVTPKRVKEGISTRFDDVKSRVNDKFKSFKDINEAYTEPTVTANDFSGIRDTFKSEPSSSFDGTASEWNVDSPTDMRRAVYDRLRSDGFFTDTEAAALTGNIAQESGFNTKAISGDGYGSQGLVQFTGSRLDDLMQFAKDNASDPYDWRTQVDFIKHEMRNKESAALERMRNNPNATPEEMAVIVREAYERPDPAYANDANRMQQAREVYDGQASPHNNTVRAYDGDITNRVVDETYNPQTIDFTNEGRMTERGIVEQPNLNIMEPEIQNQIVYHGTGYKFDAFDNSKANTGAGQQAHGAGTYFATDKAVAKVYRDGVKEKTGEGYLKKVDIPEDETILYEDYPLKNNSKTTIDNVKRAIDSLDGDAKTKMVTYLKNKLGYNEYVDGYQELVKKQEFMTKKMANLEDFLNGESVSPLKMKSALKSAGISGDFKDSTVITKAVESLRKQLDDLSKEREAIELKGRNANTLSPEMIEAQPSLLIDEHLKNTQSSAKVLNGRDIYRGLREALGDDVSASRYLDIHGVDGLSYHDMKEGKNYVIFNPEKARILEQDVQYMRKNSGNGAGIFVEKESQVKTESVKPTEEALKETKQASSESSYRYSDIKPEELAEKIKAEEIKPKFRKYDETKLAEYEKYSEEEVVSQVKKNIMELTTGVDDPLGNKVKVMLDADNIDALNDIANAFMRGHGEGKPISKKRAFATSLIKETATNPDLILRQSNGRNAYVAYWKGADNINHEIIVSLDNADRGKIISSHVAVDGKGNRNKAIKKFISDTKKADAIVYVSDNIRNELEGGPSQYRRPPTSDRGSTLDTQLHPSSNLNIADGVEKVKVEDVQNFSDNSNSPYRYVDGTENLNIDRAVSRKEIFNIIDENFKEIRHGRIGKRGVGGFYNRRTDALRVKQYGDFETSAHELGHYVDNHFGFTKNSSSYYPELIDNVRKRFGDGYENLGELGVAKEGFAEFFRDYTTNRARAKTDFPQFYDEFKKALASDAELNKRVENVSGVLHQWYRQNPHERLKGSITFGRDGSIVQDLSKDPRGTVKRFLDDAYTRVVDELHPLQQIVEQVESITGEKLDYNQNPFMQAWTARGWVGKAEVLLEKSENGFISFKDAIKPIPENIHKDFSTYLVAKRQMDILKWNAEHPKDQIYTDKTLHDINATIQHYENAEFGRTFKTAQQNIVQYSNYLLDMAVDAGLITQDSVIAMRQKYPNYVPFIRDFGKAGIENFGNTGGGFMNVKAPIKAMKGSARDIVDPLESIIKNTYSFVRAVERNKVAKSFVDISKIDGMSKLVEVVDGTPSARDNTFYVMEDGVKKVYQTEPDIYKALQFTNAESSNWIVDVMKTPAGWLRAGATQLSPEFILRNPVRDMIGATIYSKHGFIPVVDTVKGVMHYLKKDKVYWDYLESGAGNSGMVSLDRNYLQNSIRDILKQPSVVKKVITSPLDVIRGLNEATEMATRLAEFDNARKGHTGIINRLTGGKKKPLSSAEAGIQARDVTLDFSRIGKNTKSANKMIAFFNASLQGTDKMIRAFKENPAQMTMKTAAFITLPSVALWWLNKDDPRYQELPQWEKDVFWIIPTEDTLIKIPKPFELGILFGTVPERALQYAYDKQKGVDGRGFEGVGTTALDNMMPSLMPTAAIPILEWATNYSFFMQRDIVPQSMTKLPDHLQSDWRTSFIGNQVGQAFDVSPMKVDNTIRGYGGGFGSLIMDMTDRASGVADTRPAKKWNEQPVIKGFTETPYKSSDSVQRLYDEYNKQDSLLQARKLTGEKQEGFDAKTYNRTKQAYQQLQQLNKAAKKIRESKKLNSEQKREKLDKIDFQKVNAARRGLGLQPVSR